MDIFFTDVFRIASCHGARENTNQVREGGIIRVESSKQLFEYVGSFLG